MILGSSCIRRAICRLLIAGTFFAHAVGTAQACIEATQTPTMAFANANHEGNCTDTVNQNACLQQYTAGDQSSPQVQVAVAMMPAVAVLTVPIAAERSRYLVATLWSLAHSRDPPPSIRFCSFQI